ncbi:hypothetical protein D3C85_1401430 [compost metagenome]
MICPPLREAERRYSSGDWRAAPFDEVEHIAWRCSEANRRTMPPDGYRSEGTPSLSEGPDARGERFFAYFFEALVKKVSRRKGETASGLNRSNGYTHPPTHSQRPQPQHRIPPQPSRQQKGANRRLSLYSRSTTIRPFQPWSRTRRSARHP